MNADVEKAVESWREKCEAIQQNRDFWFQVAEEHRLARVDAEQALRDQEAEIARLRGLLHAESVLLRAWARESREGGWSTHQVDPMNRRADEITAHLGAEQ